MFLQIWHHSSDHEWIATLVIGVELRFPLTQEADSVAASELMHVLPRLRNLRELSVERPSNKGSLQFDSICNTLAAIGSQLT
jgi:hypothetical protein